MTAPFALAKGAAADLAGVGLGLRWDFLTEVLEAEPLPVKFFEVSPENYMRRGGYFPAALEELSERYRMISHGLTMSVGATDPPEPEYLAGVNAEIARVRSPWHSDHLCLSTAGPLVLHDLLPLHLTRAEARRIADRIRFLQDELDVPFGIENISFYAHPAEPELPEAEFLAEVLRLSQAGLLLDVNNVYVNAQNHGYEAEAFIRSLPLDQVVQIHIAGHTVLPAEHPAGGMLLDTHGAPVIDPVKELLGRVLPAVGPVPVLLERDNDVPELSELLAEVAALQEIYDAALG